MSDLRPDVTAGGTQRCPACGSLVLDAGVCLGKHPVVLNYRFKQKSEAMTVPRREIWLRECTDCGLVFNAAYDESAIPYDQRYDNRQGFSAAFVSMLEETADVLTERYSLEGRTILEVGCGKGDFLRLICQRAQARGCGFDTTCECEGLEEGEGVRFFKRHARSEDATGPLQLVVCRHVIEHVKEIGEFLQLLAAISKNGGGAPVYLETPSWEWITEHAAFWDVFYEHCNYFGAPTLRYLAERSGFVVTDHRLIFGNQFQVLEIRLRSEHDPAPTSGELGTSSLGRFFQSFLQSRESLEERLQQAGAARGWAIWGAGAKGVSLANMMASPAPSLVVDVNPAKQNTFVPGSGVPVVAPTDPRLADIAVVLVANSNYVTEIRDQLSSLNLAPQLVVI